MKKDKRPTKIYPERREIPEFPPLDEPPHKDVILLPDSPQPPII